MTDHRKFPRLPVALKVNYRNQGELAHDLITDLSSGGLFIRTSRPLEIGTQVELEIQVGDESDPTMTIRGKVVWLRPKDGKDAREGMGIQFTGVLGPVLHDLVTRTK